MPEGTEKSPNSEEQASPVSVSGGGSSESPLGSRQKLLVLLAIGGGFLLFYLFFAFYLMASLPAADGGGQALQAFGNFFYGGVSLVVLSLFGLLTLRILRMGITALRLLLRPGIVVLVMLLIAGMVFATINRQPALPIDILEPQELQGLTAPVTVTFGTENLRNILKKRSLFPRKFLWDFNGDGKVDAERQEQEVTTVYRRKGNYAVLLTVQLSDGSSRTAVRRISIPSGVFMMNPEQPLRGERVSFDATDLVENPKNLDRIQWDFNGDGTVDQETNDLIVQYTFAEAGTFQTKVLVLEKSGLQETYVRPVTVLTEHEQPFAVRIETEGALRGSAPLGILFHASVGEGVRPAQIHWAFRNTANTAGAEEENMGERVTHIFSVPGEYMVVLTVEDEFGRKSEAHVTVSALEPLELRDLLLTGSPKPERNRSTGTAPLEVRLSGVTNTPFITFRWEQENASRVFSLEGEYHALYEEPGTFPVLLIARDAEERTQKVPLEITVLPPKSRVSFTAVPATGIAPLTVTFDASQSFVPEGRITGFSWIFGDSGREEKPQLLGAQVSHRYETEGTFTVVVRALTEEGQSYEARKTIVVRSPTLDACVFPSRTVGTVPMGVRFDASCSTGKITAYTWDFGDGATSEQKVPVQDHVFTIPGVYTVKLEITDDQGNFSSAMTTITAR